MLDLKYVITGFKQVYEGGVLSQSSVSGRLVFWEYFFELIKEKPILGYGPSKGWADYTFADNNYVYIVFKYGFAGLILTLGLWFLTMRFLIKSYKGYEIRHVGFAVSLGSTLLASAVLAESLESLRLTPFFFLLAGFIYKGYLDARKAHVLGVI